MRPRSGPAPIRRTALKTAAAEWDDTTERLGVDSQKAFYEEFLKLPGATADNTVEKLGMAVKLERLTQARCRPAAIARRAGRRHS